MKALRTKVILSGIVLMFAFIATIGTTFAWFNVSQTVTVDNFNLTVTAEDSLLIQVAGPSAVYTDAPTLASAYQSIIANGDIDALYSGFTGYRMQPVTAVSSYYDGVTEVSVTPFDLRSIDAAADAKTIQASVAGDKNSTTGKYIELKFFLLYQSADNTTAELVLNAASTEILAGNILESDGNTLAQDDVADAVRIGVKLNGTDGTTPFTPTEFIFGNTKDFGYTFTVGKAGYVTTETAYTAFNELETINMTDASGILDVTNVTNNANVQTLTEAEGSTVIGNIYAGEQNMVTVSIWVEGWSLATTDAIIEAIFNIGFGFTIINAA